jgi:hypothetical protein
MTDWETWSSGSMRTTRTPGTDSTSSTAVRIACANDDENREPRARAPFR